MLLRTRLALHIVLGALLLGVPAGSLSAAERLDKRRVQELATRFFEARPATRFQAWEAGARRALLAEAAAIPLPEGGLEKAVEILWKAARKAVGRAKVTEIETPYGTATWLQSGRGGSKSGLVLALHGGGEGAGSASGAAGVWKVTKCMEMAPQGIRLVGDTWNSVHGERFLLTLAEIAKVRHEIDPDRVYVAGFSMGGTGSFHMVGRHPDLFAGAIPAHGVFMAAPHSKLETAAQVETFQHGLLPNVRNTAVYFYTGRDDKNCEPGTFLYAWDRLQELRAADPGGYQRIHFAIHEGLAHSFPPGEPSKGVAWIGKQRREAFPDTLVWEYAVDPFPLPDAEDKVVRSSKHFFYWLHCERPVDGMEVTATRSGNAFDLEVTTDFPEDFSVFLRPEMFDVDEDVVLRVDGREVYRGKPRPDLAAVFESLDAKLDRRLVFDRRVRIPEQ